MEISAKRKTREVNSNADIRFFMLALECHDSRHWENEKNRKSHNTILCHQKSMLIRVGSCCVTLTLKHFVYKVFT